MFSIDLSYFMQIFELMPHTADWKIKVAGASQEDLFEHAVYAMFASIKPHYVSQKELLFDVDISASNQEQLLVDFLSEALYIADAYGVACKSAVIHYMHDARLRATLTCLPIKGFDEVQIKAVTYHALRIYRQDSLWIAEIVFDI